MPVIDAPGAGLSNFPKSHELYLGLDTIPIWQKWTSRSSSRTQAPWYPPSNAPKNANIVAVGSNPLKDTMVYQVTNAEHYLEGNRRSRSAF